MTGSADRVTVLKLESDNKLDFILALQLVDSMIPRRSYHVFFFLIVD